MDISRQLMELEQHLGALRSRFIDGFLPADPLVSPDVYALDVQAYCVLCHAAFEEFVEDVALESMQLSCDRWLRRKSPNDTLLSLFATYGNPAPQLPDDTQELDLHSFDTLRKGLRGAKTAFSKVVYENHGISPKYLGVLLQPVGLDLRLDLKTTASLNRLARERGRYAHKRLITQPIAPEDALECVADCLEVCRKITRSFAARFDESLPYVCNTGSHI